MGRVVRVTVVVVGDALIDEMRDERGSVDAPGGSALNVAVGLAILGVPTRLVAMYSDDADGRVLAAHLAHHGVDAVASPSALGTGRAVSDRSKGEPRYHFSPAAIARTLTFTPEMQTAIADASLVAISGFPLDDQTQFEQLLDVVSESTVLLDPNPRSGLLRDRELFAANLERIAPRLRLLKLGDDDARLLFGAPLNEVAARFAAHTTVLATAGAAGASVYEKGMIVKSPVAIAEGPVVDTMGAGDATFASVIASLNADESDWAAILDRAMRIAAATVRQHGGLLRAT